MAENKLGFHWDEKTLLTGGKIPFIEVVTTVTHVF